MSNIILIIICWWLAGIAIHLWAFKIRPEKTPWNQEQLLFEKALIPPIMFAKVLVRFWLVILYFGSITLWPLMLAGTIRYILKSKKR